MMKKDVETETGYFRERICSIARDYATDRYDCALIAIGSAAERALRKVMPLEEARVFYHAVNHSRHTLAAQKNISNDVAHIEIYSHKPMEVRVVNAGDDSLDDDSMRGDDYAMAKFETTTADISNNESDITRTALRVFTEFQRSDSYILLSAFGNRYAQAMHSSISRIMSSRNIPHLNVIIKPSRLYPSERSIAEGAINRLVSAGERVRVIDNQDLEENLTRHTTGYSVDGQWGSINTKIAREIEVYLMKLSNASINAKKIVAF
ncbi:MAG: hypothetical protein QW597_05555 [Thermoplasmataceae archaeon]